MIGTITHQVLSEHMVSGRLSAGEEIAIRIDQTLMPDSSGTMVWQQFIAFGVPRVASRVSVTYVDHNMLQTGYENADDHLFLQSCCAKFGAIFSRPGNGISHLAHLERFDVPGETMLGADSHTCSAGALSMLAIGAGGAEVAAAMAGEPFYFRCPRIISVRLTGQLNAWVSAKDIILELLRRLSVNGGIGAVIEYGGNGLEHLTVWDRETICNMSQELGATSAIFPSDKQTRRFLKSQQREADWRPLEAEHSADYDDLIEIDLGALEPLVAMPSSPDNVVAVREVAGTPLRQVAVGSSVNSSYRDIMSVGLALRDRNVHPGLHMTLSPGSRQTLLNVMKTGIMSDVVRSGVRALEIACGPCIGMGAAPPSNGNSLRSFNRNFPGRSGTADDRVWLASPETCAASAISGVITDPRTMGSPVTIREPEIYEIYEDGFIHPDPNPEGIEIYSSPNIIPPPQVPELSDSIRGEVLLVLGDHVSTDTISPSGNKVLPLRSNIPALSELTFANVDPKFADRARHAGTGIVIGGRNFGQGSSREHAAIALMYLGIRAVIAEDYARIHEANLINFGIPPLRFEDASDKGFISPGDTIELSNLKRALISGEGRVVARVGGKRRTFNVSYDLSPRQRDILIAGGLATYLRSRSSRVTSET